MSDLTFQHVKVVIVPADQPHVAIMNFITQGRGNILPDGAAWISDGWWIRPPEPRLIEASILKWRQIGTPGERPVPLRWFIANAEDIPTDRDYRNAHVAHATESRVVHDMERARSIHRDKLREQRAVVMSSLDGQWMRALGKDNKKEADDIEAKRQLLRDAPADVRIDLAKNIDDLRAIELPLSV